jgi:hypothetical protein
MQPRPYPRSQSIKHHLLLSVTPIPMPNTTVCQTRLAKTSVVNPQPYQQPHLPLYQCGLMLRMEL